MSEPVNDLYIGNTDHDWYEFCRSRSPLQEVNFWQPSRQHFRAIEEGGIFFFRRKSPINKIGGFGTLATSGSATIGLLWDDLGESNGVNSQEDFISKVSKYRNSGFVDRNTCIGFKILIDPVFLDEADWFELPEDWSPNIVTGKSYSSSSISGIKLIEHFREHNRSTKQFRADASTFDGFNDNPQAGYHSPALAKVRMGQSAFRLSILGAYGGKCAVTGTEVQAVLEAAHINQFATDQDHSVSNGILMRKDIHALFDCGYIVINEDYRIHLTDRFTQDYPHVNDYRNLEGLQIDLPRAKQYRPSKEALRSHQKRWEDRFLER